MNSFLLYLVIRFARENSDAKSKDDPILGKKVPSIVFLRNQQLLKEVLKEKIEDEQRLKETLKYQAELNEYMYIMVRETGVDRLDEDIGMEFINIDDRTSDHLPENLENQKVSFGFPSNGTDTCRHESLYEQRETPSVNSEVLLDMEVDNFF